MSFLIMFSAKRDIALVATELYLFSLCDHLSVQESGVEMRSLAAPADGLDLLYIVRQLHKTLCAGKKMALKISPQTVADDSNAMEIHEITELVYHFR